MKSHGQQPRNGILVQEFGILNQHMHLFYRKLECVDRMYMYHASISYAFLLLTMLNLSTTSIHTVSDILTSISRVSSPTKQ